MSPCQHASMQCKRGGVVPRSRQCMQECAWPLGKDWGNLVVLGAVLRKINAADWLRPASYSD